MTASSAKYRPMTFGVTRVQLRDGVPGTRYMRAEPELQPYAPTMGERLVHWATTTPERTLFARRSTLADSTNNSTESTGDWVHLSFAQALSAARHIGQALLDRGLNAERPVLILSDNDLEHAMLSLACLYVGVPYCAISPAYSTLGTTFDKFRHAMATLTPGLVFASDGARFGKGLTAVMPEGCEIALTSVAGFTRTAGSISTFEQLLNTAITPAVDAAFASLTPESIAKFSFTSGSTKMPKAVITTQRMWCANQQQMAQSMQPITDGELVLVDWLPWNHTFGGNHNFGMVITHGGTLYIDDGKPTPAGMAETLRNLREIAPTLYFNVPTGFEVIAEMMKTDDLLRKNLLSRVRMFFYAAAALSQPIWDALHSAQEREIGERIVMATGLGMTETCPFALCVTNANVKAGDIGVPTPGMEVKLIDVDGKVEVRYKGPNVTPGYWRNPEATAEAFDEEGFFASGDAVKWIDAGDVHQGLAFGGRIAEDFKLSTGTFVSVGPMRSKIIAAGAPYVQDVVLTGLNLKEVGAMVFPTGHVRRLSGLEASASMADVLASAPVLAHFQNAVNTLAQAATGSASRVARLCLLDAPPSLDLGEITDKGSINQRAVLKHREAIVNALNDDSLLHVLKPQTSQI